MMKTRRTMPWSMWVASGLALAYAATFAYVEQPRAVEPEPVTTAVYIPEPVTAPVPRYIYPVPEQNLEAQMLADAIWEKRGGRTEELTPHMAYVIAEAATECWLDPWILGGLAWFESGFNPEASSPSGRHHGLYQKLNDLEATDIPGHTARTCDGLREWKELCDARHPGEHDWLAHHFSGTEVSPRAEVNARVVRHRAKLLRKTVTDGDE